MTNKIVDTPQDHNTSVTPTRILCSHSNIHRFLLPLLTDCQIIEFGNDGEGPADRVQSSRDLAHGGERLDSHHPPLGVDFENVDEVDANVPHRLLVLADPQTDGHPARARRAHVHPTAVHAPFLHLR